MPKRIALCFDGTWNTPAEKFTGLAALHARFEQLAGLNEHEALAAIEQVDANAGVETNVCRLYRSVSRHDAGGAQGDGWGQTNETVDGRIKADLTYRPKNSGLSKILGQ